LARLLFCWDRVDGTAVNGVVAQAAFKLLEQVGCAAASQRVVKWEPTTKFRLASVSVPPKPSVAVPVCKVDVHTCGRTAVVHRVQVGVVDAVRDGTAVQAVVARAANQVVRPAPPSKVSLPSPPSDGVSTVAADDDVVARCAGQMSLPSQAGHCVVAGAPVKLSGPGVPTRLTPVGTAAGL
jgi:hypothetical protein